MRPSESFIPRDKPKFWVLAVLSWLTGVAIGALAFAASWTEYHSLTTLLKLLFVLCWVAGAVSWAGFALGMLLGRYRGIQAQSWREQVW